MTSLVATEELSQFNLHLAAAPATGDMPLAQLSAREGLHCCQARRFGADQRHKRLIALDPEES